MRKKVKIAIVVGTRPEIIKMAPIIKECCRRKIRHIVIHSGQHYTHCMSEGFFKDLGLKKPDFNLCIGSGSHPEQTAKILLRLEKYLLKEKPDVVLVEGDTNTVFASALCAAQLKIKIGHVEAGLRSFDRSMPEEINRILVDHIADFLFVPTNISRGNLLKESVDRKKIYVTGNTIVDALYQSMQRIDSSAVLKKLNLKKSGYFLLTLHRNTNVDDKEIFSKILKGLELISEKFNLPVVYPIHPRARKNFEKFGFSCGKNLILTDPVGYIDFLKLQKNAKLVLTDSGGVQEETCILRVPCVTIRLNTERPETLKVKSNILSGLDSKSILRCAVKMLKADKRWANPFGQGQAAKKTIAILEKELIKGIN
ncbi:MAG: UDP-N-acetylglucosamine 2-epimerase (non-hydrolyzing) [Candidatus Omnitrophota bacterium]